MLRHEFRPGRLVAGVTGLVVATVYGGDAAGSWDVPWYAAVPILFCGLVLAAAAAWAGYRVRRRRAARAASADGADAPARTSGSHAIR
ncbi:hypothetical protein [Streptomyces roseolilacinus]|uniref:Uncharacterized protein n=1 Tax=Streptomyces roseolilacinus TaxID=66904 RepID=A0A918AVR0_9ACTN|nr:hypothetical protein [Streptomyces roseolilacinus]GGP90772.1 hypothetical protein GCM10010249_05970 [Streptomyces roseolilacinus]